MSGLDRRSLLLRAGAAALAAGTPFGWELVGAGAQGSTTQRRLRELSRALRGPLLTPSSSGYRSAALVYNERYDGTRPLAVARCASASDVQDCVRWAAKYDVRVAARSGGHSYAGYSTTTGLVIDVSGLDAINVGTGATTATIGAGAQLIDVYAGLARRGVTIPAGSCPSVGIGGLAQGGGIGLASRKLGMTCDNIIALDIVTADGRLLRCDADTNEDLYWACRGGGGGNFGVVTRFVFRTFRVRSAAYFFARWPWGAAEDAIAAWQSFAPEAPDELMSLLNLSTGGPTVTCVGQYFGSAGSLRGLLGPLRRSGASISTGSSSYLALQKRWAGCADMGLAQCHTRGESAGGTLARAIFAGKSDYFARALSGSARRTMTRYIEQRNGQSGSGAIVLDAYGGKINSVKPGATAFVHRDQLFSAQYLSYWGSSRGAGQGLRWIRSFRAAMQGAASGFAYQNYIDPDLRSWKKAYYGSNYNRLVRVKTQYDPDNLFRFKQSIPPKS